MLYGYNLVWTIKSFAIFSLFMQKLFLKQKRNEESGNSREQLRDKRLGTIYRSAPPHIRIRLTGKPLTYFYAQNPLEQKVEVRSDVGFVMVFPALNAS